jgi:hypothetical protein
MVRSTGKKQSVKFFDSNINKDYKKSITLKTPAINTPKKSSDNVRDNKN